MSVSLASPRGRCIEPSRVGTTLPSAVGTIWSARTGDASAAGKASQRYTARIPLAGCRTMSVSVRTLVPRVLDVRRRA
jgi:hypothetical protein